MRLTPKQEVDIINAYKVDLEPIISIAQRYHVTRQAIYKALHRNGIDTSKESNGHITVTCTCCGQPVTKYRAYLRNRKHVFCDTECYYAYIEGKQQGAYNESRQGQRIARTVIKSTGFNLLPEHIVHHEDRNNMNNNLENLRVFANQGDHIRYHRWSKDGVEIKPIWDGRYI